MNLFKRLFGHSEDTKTTAAVFVSKPISDPVPAPSRPGMTTEHALQEICAHESVEYIENCNQYTSEITYRYSKCRVCGRSAKTDGRGNSFPKIPVGEFKTGAEIDIEHKMQLEKFIKKEAEKEEIRQKAKAEEAERVSELKKELSAKLANRCGAGQ